MGTEDHDISSLQAQLTVARWHLDASAHAAADAMRRHRERARNAHETVRRMLSYLDVSPAEREAIERELLALQSRLEAL